MWIFGRHRHISHEVLSEYLDGRLHGAQRERVGRQVTSCALCQEELESLRATISLLRDLPDVPAPRSFTLAGPPRVVTTQSAPRPFRAPSWAYAGAASLAGLALAVMVSADATGLFTPSTVTPPPESFAAQATQPTPAPGTAANSAEDLSTTEAENDSAPETESMQALRASEAPKSDGEPAQGGAAQEADQPPASEQDAESSEGAPAPPAAAEDAGVAGPEGTAGASGAATEGGLPSDEPDKGAGASSGEDAPALAQSEPPVDAAREVPTSEPGLVSEFIAEEMGTPLVWRVLEGVAAALLVMFLTFLFLQRRRTRRLVNN